MKNNESITKANEMATNHEKSWILSLKTNTKDVNNRVYINEVTTAYYEGLFNASCRKNWTPCNLSEDQEIPEFLTSEVINAIKWNKG